MPPKKKAGGKKSLKKKKGAEQEEVEVKVALMSGEAVVVRARTLDQLRHELRTEMTAAATAPEDPSSLLPPLCLILIIDEKTGEPIEEDIEMASLAKLELRGVMEGSTNFIPLDKNGFSVQWVDDEWECGCV